MPRPPLLPALAVLALIIGCGSGDDATAPGDGNTPAGQLPDELVGKWHFEQILDQTCDPDTGECVPTSARSETLTLTGEGRFEHALYAESNFPPCNLTALHQSEGTARVQGSTLALHITDGVTRVEDSCGEDSQTDEDGETDTYTWELSADGAGAPQLTLTDEAGNTIGPFEPQS